MDKEDPGGLNKERGWRIKEQEGCKQKRIANGEIKELGLLDGGRGGSGSSIAPPRGLMSLPEESLPGGGPQPSFSSISSALTSSRFI